MPKKTISHEKGYYYFGTEGVPGKLGTTLDMRKSLRSTVLRTPVQNIKRKEKATLQYPSREYALR